MQNAFIRLRKATSFQLRFGVILAAALHLAPARAESPALSLETGSGAQLGAFLSDPPAGSEPSLARPYTSTITTTVAFAGPKATPAAQRVSAQGNVTDKAALRKAAANAANITPAVTTGTAPAANPSCNLFQRASNAVGSGWRATKQGAVNAYNWITATGKRIAQAAASSIHRESSGHYCWRGVKATLCKSIPSTCGKFGDSGYAREAAELLPKRAGFTPVAASGDVLHDPLGTVHVYKDTGTCRNKKGKIIECPGHVDVASVNESGKPMLVSDFRAYGPPSKRYVLIATLRPPENVAQLDLVPDTKTAARLACRQDEFAYNALSTYRKKSA